jgi:hypothetical protein
MLDDQIAQLQRELAARPADEAVRARLAELLGRGGQDDEAAAHLVAILAREPANRAAAGSLMRLVRRALGDPEREPRTLETFTVWRPDPSILSCT